MYYNYRENWKSNHGTLNFKMYHINDVLVETWEAFKISPTYLTDDSFNNNPLPTPYQYTNTQACLASDKMTKGWKLEDIKVI